MRMKDDRALRRIALWTLLPVVIFFATPDAVAGGLIGPTPNLWATATAMSLTLLTIVSANDK